MSWCLTAGFGTLPFLHLVGGRCVFGGRGVFPFLQHAKASLLLSELVCTGLAEDSAKIDDRDCRDNASSLLDTSIHIHKTLET